MYIIRSRNNYTIHFWDIYKAFDRVCHKGLLKEKKKEKKKKIKWKQQQKKEWK